MAKGVEDCAFYRWSRLTSLNEVGGDPSVFAVTSTTSTRRWRPGRRDWPHAMTDAVDPRHQARRGRPRPDHRAGRAPRRLGGGARRAAGAGTAARPGLRIPAVAGDPRRLARFSRAAVCTGTPRRRCARPATARPGPSRTRPTRPRCTPRSTRPSTATAYAACSTACSPQVDEPGRSNALAAKLVALTMPGVPDVYQGSELWEQSLVDPDNRRSGRLRPPRGGARRDGRGRRRRQAAASPGPRSRLRRDRPDLFTTYTPVLATGPGRRARARLRPRRRDHRRHPAAGRARRAAVGARPG